MTNKELIKKGKARAKTLLEALPTGCLVYKDLDDMISEYEKLLKLPLPTGGQTLYSTMLNEFKAHKAQIK